jgi:general secretion pathway protein G
MTHSQHRRGGRGFTLIEMLVVLGILGMLLALAVPRILGTQKKADISTTQSQIKLLSGCLQGYFLDMKEYPSTEQGLKALVEKPSELSEAKAKRWDGPYIESGELPKDPWGNDFRYEYPSKHGVANSPDIWSAGPDGEEGSDDDIVSWNSDNSDNKSSSDKPSGNKSSGDKPRQRSRDRSSKP